MGADKMEVSVRQQLCGCRQDEGKRQAAVVWMQTR